MINHDVLSFLFPEVDQFFKWIHQARAHSLSPSLSCLTLGSSTDNSIPLPITPFLTFYLQGFWIVSAQWEEEEKRRKKKKEKHIYFRLLDDFEGARASQLFICKWILPSLTSHYRNIFAMASHRGAHRAEKYSASRFKKPFLIFSLLPYHTNDVQMQTCSERTLTHTHIHSTLGVRQQRKEEVKIKRKKKVIYSNGNGNIYHHEILL